MAAPTPVNLPIIDFTACNLANENLDLSDDDVKRVADEVVKGLEDYSAVYLINHGMSTEGVREFVLLRNNIRQTESQIRPKSHTKMLSVAES